MSAVSLTRIFYAAALANSADAMLRSRVSGEDTEHSPSQPKKRKVAHPPSPVGHRPSPAVCFLLVAFSPSSQYCTHPPQRLERARRCCCAELRCGRGAILQGCAIDQRRAEVGPIALQSRTSETSLAVSLISPLRFTGRDAGTGSRDARHHHISARAIVVGTRHGGKASHQLVRTSLGGSGQVAPSRSSISSNSCSSL